MTTAEEESAEEEAAESDATTATDVASAHQSDSDSDANVVDERRRGGSADDAEMRFLQARPTLSYPNPRHVCPPGMAGGFGIYMPVSTDRSASAYPTYVQLQKSAT